MLASGDRLIVNKQRRVWAGPSEVLAPGGSSAVVTKRPEVRSRTTHLPTVLGLQTMVAVGIEQLGGAGARIELERSSFTLLVEIEVGKRPALGEPHRPVGAKHVAGIEQFRRSLRRIAVGRVFPNDHLRLGCSDRLRPRQQRFDVRTFVRLVMDQQSELVRPDALALEVTDPGGNPRPHATAELGRTNRGTAQRSRNRPSVVGHLEKHMVSLSIGPLLDPVVKLLGVQLDLGRIARVEFEFHHHSGSRPRRVDKVRLYMPKKLLEVVRSYAVCATAIGVTPSADVQRCLAREVERPQVYGDQAVRRVRPADGSLLSPKILLGRLAIGQLDPVIGIAAVGIARLGPEGVRLCQRDVFARLLRSRCRNRRADDKDKGIDDQPESVSYRDHEAPLCGDV